MKTSLTPQFLLNLTLASLLLLLLGWSLYSKPWQPLLADISTAADEQITVLLEDSTELSLGENSLADINIDSSQRYFHFIAGKFNVETSELCERNLPVLVDTPHGKVNPQDSRFSLDIRDNEAWLTVSKGSVTLYRNSQVQVINADHSVRFTRNNILAVTQ